MRSPSSVPATSAAPSPRRSTRAGHEVTIAAAHPEHAAAGGRAPGATAAQSTPPPSPVPTSSSSRSRDRPRPVATEIADDLAGKVVVDVSNRPTPDPAGPGTSIAEELQDRLPRSRVVKAFNTRSPRARPTRSSRASPPTASWPLTTRTPRQTVLDASSGLGFRPVDAGPLAGARTLEGMAWLNIHRNMSGGAWQDACVLVGPETRCRGEAERAATEPRGEADPMGIPVSRLNHAVLFVRDATRAAEFYGRVFGFEVVGTEFGGQAVFMRSPLEGNHHDLGLFSVGPDAPRPPRGSVGLYHLAWEVPTIEDLEAAADTLSEAGALGGASDHGVSKSLYGQDPDGNEFEIMWRVPRAAWGEFEKRGAVMPLDIEPRSRGSAVRPGPIRDRACRRNLISQRGCMLQRRVGDPPLIVSAASCLVHWGQGGTAWSRLTQRIETGSAARRSPGSASTASGSGPVTASDACVRRWVASASSSETAARGCRSRRAAPR